MSAVVFLRVCSIVSCLGLGAASAQSLSDTNSPAELPPAGFTASQYVDSNGCLFIRAGLNGNVTWVPRVNRNRELLCGFQPTVVATATPVAPAPTVVRKKARSAAMPKVVSVPRTVDRPAEATATARIPKGFRAAWDDGRLNPNRGPQTALGNDQMAQIWTNRVPAKLVTKRKPATLATTATTVSTRSVRTKPGAGLFVQVGIFADPANATTVISRIQAAGLPVSLIRKSNGGSVYQTVLAGPFAGRGDADKALVQARSSGFPDAFIR